MKKIMTVIGARPQFIKAAVVSRLLHHENNIEEIIVHTGQHYDTNMSQIFFDELAIPKIDHHLNVGSALHGKQTGEMISNIENLLIETKPDFLLIYGDTNSTLAGALAAAKLHIPIAHVEAGLRSYNRKMPEEINRIIADQLSNILFTPTTQAVNNLIQEGYDPSRIIEVGDVMYDAACFYVKKALNESQILEKLNVEKKNYLLATIHRPENTDDVDKLNNIFTALDKLTQELTIIMPLHPRTRKMLNQHLPMLLNNSSIHIIEPVGFLDMVMLEKHASLIVTDSGGIQKEAFFYQVPCVTLREQTEWVETVELGWNHLVKPESVDMIHDQILQVLGTSGLCDQYPYGKGDAGERIVAHLKEGV